jgi:peptidoglycan/xylan/chitin deacetylase (PgdA/CDA1 family)
MNRLVTSTSFPLLGRASGTAYFDDVTVQEFAPQQSAVSLIFDDGEANTFNKAAPVLQNHNMVASVAIPVEAIGDDGYMTENQIRKLLDRGWELISHSVNHVNLLTLSPSQQLNQLSQSKTTLSGRLGTPVNSFALPEGAYNGFILGEGQKYYRSIRAFELGDNPQGTFPYDVKVRSVVENTSMSDVQSWLNSAKQNGRWEVIVFHTINKNGDDPYHISRAGLQDIIRAIEASGIPVVTYNEGLNRFAVSR